MTAIIQCSEGFQGEFEIQIIKCGQHLNGTAGFV